MSRADSADSGEPRAEEEGMTLEERLRRLDEIVSRLESNDLELDKALALFEEGVRHVRSAERTLAETELRVEELLGGEDGLQVETFDPNEP